MIYYKHIRITIGEFVLPHLLGEYKKKHDNIDVIMHVYNLEESLKRLSNGEFDLSIVEGPFDKTKYNYKKLKKDELVHTNRSWSYCL